jgi:hypothetical protein
MAKKELLNQTISDWQFVMPRKIWWDPIPDWFKVINKEQWFRFQELEIDLQKKELDLQQQRIKGMKEIMK